MIDENFFITSILNIIHTYGATRVISELSIKENLIADSFFRVRADDMFKENFA